MFKALRFLLLFILTFSSIRVFSQFPYVETFKNSIAPGIIAGGGDNPATEGHAFLTANTSDPLNTMPIPDANGDGYLRLTNNLTYQKGFIYNEDIRIPSTNGLKIEFEYYTYSPAGNPSFGADGICFFLFDADVLQTTGFKIGGFGGSLGYAQYHKKDVPSSSGPIEVHAPGVTGGYLGIGLDEYGYFARDEEGRQPKIGAGKQPSPKRGSVAIRGKGNGEAEIPGNYPLLAYQRTEELLIPFNLIGNSNLRQPIPTHASYRKAIIILEPHPSGGYNISVDIITGGTPQVTHRVINQFHYAEVASERLAYGISSSTGNNVNFHEIRNLKIDLYEDKPIGISDDANTLTNVSIDIPVKDNDMSKTNTIVIRGTDPPNGTYTIINSDTEINYVPNPGFSGTDVFTYKLYDNVTGKESNPITITVNVKPIGSPDTYTTPLNTTIPIDVKDNDISKNGTTVVLDTHPSNGTVSINPITNIVTYTPNNNFVGSDGFTYKLRTSDGVTSDPISVNVTVNASQLIPAKIGLAKGVTSVTKNLDGSFNLTYLFTLVNYGEITIDNLSLIDNLDATFQGASYSIKRLSATGSLNVNLAYDGSLVQEMLLPSSTLKPVFKEQVELELLVNLNDKEGLFNNIAVVEGLSTGDGSTTTDISTNGLSPDPILSGDVSPQEVTPVTLMKQKIFIPEGFSPNSDGINDFFIIQNSLGKQVALEIYNRWGNRIYKSSDYQNNWNGVCTEGVYIGQDVPVGTYYYIVIIDNEKKAGYITINR